MGRPRGSLTRPSVTAARRAWQTASQLKQDTIAAQPIVREYRGTARLADFGPGIIARSVLGGRVWR